MKRRLLAMLLSLAMVLTMLPVAAFAAEGEVGDLVFTATSTTSGSDKTVTLGFKDTEVSAGTIWYKALTKNDLETALKAPTALTDSTSSSEGYTKVESNSISNWNTSDTHIAIAFVPTQIDGSNNTAGTVTMWGTALIDAAPALTGVKATVPAETEDTAEGEVTISGTDSGAVVYYKKPADDSTEITEADRPVKDAEATDYTEYKAESKFQAKVGTTLAVAIVNSTTDTKIQSWAVVTIEKATAENQLGALNVSVGNDNKITVTTGTTGGTAVTENLAYYTVESSEKSDFDTAKASWTTNTALSDTSSTLGTALSLQDATITSSEDGKFIVVVETDGKTTPKLVAVGITASTVTYTPAATNTVKLYEGTDGTTDLLANATPDQTSGKYAVSVAKATENVKVVTTVASGATVAVTAVKGTDSVTVTDGDGYKTVPVGAGETVTITVAFTGTDAKTYTIEVTRPTEDSPTVALYEGTDTTSATAKNLLDGKSPDANKTYTVDVANTVEKVTVVATAGSNVNGTVTAKKPDGSNATVTSNAVDLEVGETTITVTFSDEPATVYTIKVNRAAAAPTVALYAGTAATGTDLLKDETPVSNKYTVEVANDVENVTVGKTAATGVTGTVTATGPDGDTNIVSVDTVTLAVGKTTITVTFNDTDETTYTIEVTRKQVAKSITVKDDATPTANDLIEFVEATTEYTVMVKDDVSKVTIAANLDATIAGEPGTTVTVNGEVSEVSKVGGSVSTVKVTFGTDPDTEVYTIKLVWPSNSADKIEETDMQVDASASVNTTDPTTATLDLTSKVDDVLVAINNTKVVNESNSTTEPVVIQATVADANKKDATEVTLPVAVSDALQETGVAASIETNVGTVTLPSEAITKAQGDTAADALKVVIKDETSSIPNDNEKEVAKFEVTVMKGANAATITGLDDNPITLVFAVLTSKIAGKVNPVLAWVDGSKYRELKKCTSKPVGTNTVFTAETTHLSEFAVVATADLTEEPAGTIAIAVEGETLSPAFNPDEKAYTVTVDKDTTSAKIVVTGVAASTVKVGDDNYTEGGVDVDLTTVPTEGKAVSVVYTPDGGTAQTYTITFKKQDTPVEQPLNVKVTDADGKEIALDHPFDPTNATSNHYYVETNADIVKFFVSGGETGKRIVVRPNGKADIEVDADAIANGVEVDLRTIGTDSKDVAVVYGIGASGADIYQFTFTKPAQTESPVTNNKVTVGDSDTSLTFEAIGSEMVAKETITLSAAQNSIKMSVAANSTVQIRNAAGNVIKSITVPADGVITVSKDDFDSGENRIEIISGGKTFVINVKKEAPVTPTLTLSKEGTIGYAIIKVKISGMTAGKVYLVESAATSSGGTVKSYSVITGDSTGEAVIAISRGNVVTVEEYNSETDIAAGNVDPTATSSPFPAQ